MGLIKSIKKEGTIKTKGDVSTTKAIFPFNNS